MAKKEETTVEQETPKEPEAKAEVQEVGTPTLTKEEVEQLRSVAQNAEKYEQNWKDAQRVISRKDEEIQSLKDDRELWKAMIGYVSQQRGISEEQAEGEIRKNQPNLAQQFDLTQKQLEQKRRVQKFNDYRTQIRKLGSAVDDEESGVIYGLVATGQYDKADKRIDSIKAKSQKTSEPKETEEEKDKRIKEEAKREALIEAGVLTPENAEPSAAGGGITLEEFSKLPPAERLKRVSDVRKSMEGKK